MSDRKDKLMDKAKAHLHDPVSWVFCAAIVAMFVITVVRIL